MGKIFISYRRDDSADITGRVYERLIKQFGPEDVFRDVDDISLGADFRVEVSKALAQCVVMIVIIGKQWLTSLSENGARRLDSPSDYVRVEVEAGLARHIPVIPLSDCVTWQHYFFVRLLSVNATTQGKPVEEGNLFD